MSFTDEDRKLLQALSESCLTFWSLVRHEVEEGRQQRVDVNVVMLADALDESYT